jgi:hypothetical protein
VPCSAIGGVFVSPIDIAGFGRRSRAHGSSELSRNSRLEMLQDLVTAERRLVHRDRLNQALERKQRRAGAAIVRPRRLIIGTGADETLQQLGWIGCNVTRWIGDPVRRRRR